MVGVTNRMVLTMVICCGKCSFVLRLQAGEKLMRTESAMRNWLHTHFLTDPYKVYGVLFVLCIIQGFFYATPQEIVDGLWQIISTPDMLVSDYIAIGGIGPTLVNVGLSGLVTIAALVFAKHEPYGLTLAVMGLISGFSFFGKNFINIIPIILGGYIYSRIVRKSFKTCILPTVCATCLAPAVSVLSHVYIIPTGLGLVLGALIGLFIGFIITPLASNIFKIHQGCNLYNVGFTSGFVGICMFALLQHLGFEYDPIYNRSIGYNVPLIIFLSVMSLYLIACGLLAKGGLVTFKSVFGMDADDNDFFKAHGERVYISMGALGLLCMGVVLIMQGDFSGTVVGGAASVVGFGAFGKSFRRSLPIMAGTLAASFIHTAFTGTPANSPGLLTVVLFSTCLSPLTKRFGIYWGFLAGFLHLVLATNVGVFHGGLNLYNNGFAGGLAAMILLPVMEFFEWKKAALAEKRSKRKNQTPRR